MPATSPFPNPPDDEDAPDPDPDIVGTTSPTPGDDSEFVTSEPNPRFEPLSALASGRAAVPVTNDNAACDVVAQYRTDSPAAGFVSVAQYAVAESVQARHASVEASQLTFGG